MDAPSFILVTGAAIAGAIEVFKPGIDRLFPEKGAARTLFIRLLVFVLGVVVLVSDPSILADDPLLGDVPQALAVVLAAGGVALSSFFANYGLQAVGGSKAALQMLVGALQVWQETRALRESWKEGGAVKVTPPPEEQKPPSL